MNVNGRQSNATKSFESGKNPERTVLVEENLHEERVTSECAFRVKRIDILVDMFVALVGSSSLSQQDRKSVVQERS